MGDPRRIESPKRRGRHSREDGEYTFSARGLERPSKGMRRKNDSQGVRSSPSINKEAAWCDLRYVDEVRGTRAVMFVEGNVVILPSTYWDTEDDIEYETHGGVWEVDAESERSRQQS